VRIIVQRDAEQLPAVTIGDRLQVWVGVRWVGALVELAPSLYELRDRSDDPVADTDGAPRRYVGIVEAALALAATRPLEVVS
jgi:hypothetical protein